MSLRLILKEHSENDFVTKYKSKFSNEILTTIIHWFDPKDWMWIGKNLDFGSNIRDLEELLVLIRSYKRLSKYLQTPQLDLFDSITSVKKQIKSFNEDMLKGLKIKEDVNTLVDNQDVKLLELKTREQICYYLPEVEECKFTLAKTLNQDKVVFILIDKKTNKKIGIVFTKSAETYDRYKKDVNPIKFYLFDGKEYVTYDNLERLKSAIDVPGIDLYYSLLLYFVELSFENLKNFDLEIFKKENRVNEFKRLAKIKKYDITFEAEERRKNNEWELDGNCPLVGLMAHAVYKFLVGEGVLTKISDEELERKKELIQKIDELQSQYDDDEEVRYDLYDQINDLEEELDEINEEYSDVYDIIPKKSYYDMTSMTCTKCNDEEYAIGTYDELQDSVNTYIEEYIDEIGVDNLGDSIIENAIDEDRIVDYFEDFYQDDLYQEPENYIDESERQLSSKQEDKIERARYNIKRTEIKIENLTDILDETEYGENYKKLENRINELEDYLTTLQDFIVEINDNPEGAYPQEKIDTALELLMNDVRYDPLGKLKSWDMEVEHFVDRERVVELIKEDGGDEMFARVDGTVYEEKVIDTWYYIIKI